MKDCATCGENPTITDVSKFGYSEFCQVNCDLVAMIKLPAENTIPIIDFGEIYKNNESMQSNTIIDVRPPVHFGIVNLPGSINLPLKTMERDPDQAKEIC